MPLLYSEYCGFIKNRRKPYVARDMGIEKILKHRMTTVDNVKQMCYYIINKEKEKKGEWRMAKLLKNKYSNILELIEEKGKIPMRCIDDGDLEQLKNEIENLGYKCKLDPSTDFLVVE